MRESPWGQKFHLDNGDVICRPHLGPSVQLGHYMLIEDVLGHFNLCFFHSLLSLPPILTRTKFLLSLDAAGSTPWACVSVCLSTMPTHTHTHTRVFEAAPFAPGSNE